MLLTKNKSIRRMRYVIAPLVITVFCIAVIYMALVSFSKPAVNIEVGPAAALHN